MRAVDLIRRKRDGLTLSEADIQTFIAGFTHGEIPDYQMAAMAMAIVFQGLGDRELAAWTDAMLHSGEILDLGLPPGTPIVDKHSTGGVGDGISLMLAPIAAACGLKVPMISGRGLGHTGGTLDKLEAIPGFDVSLSAERLKSIVHEHGFVITGQTAEIAPADSKLYALRDVTATVKCIPLIASSVMSKKLAEGLNGLVLDVKTGSGAFMKELSDARSLAWTMVAIGHRMGVKTQALITDMNQPLGRAIGNALEVREAIDVLRGAGPDDMRELTCQLAARMLVLGDCAETVEAGLALAQRTLNNGQALAKFRTVVEAQGGDPVFVDQPERLPSAPFKLDWTAPHDGYIFDIQCDEMGLIAMRLGAGRHRSGDPIDPSVGLWIHHKLGTKVTAGQPLVTIHAPSEARAQEAVSALGKAVTVGHEAPELRPLILDSMART